MISIETKTKMEVAKNMMALGVSQNLIAKYLNVTRQSVYRWLNGDNPKTKAKSTKLSWIEAQTKRAEAEVMFAKGVPKMTIAKYLNVSRPTLDRWINSNISKPE